MKRLLPLPLLLVLLPACAPVRTVIVDGLNEVGQSHGVLAYVDTGVLVDPGPTVIAGVNLDIQGNELLVSDEACVGSEEVVTCTWAALDTPHVVEVEHGLNVTATITYQRPGDVFWRHEILSD